MTELTAEPTAKPAPPSPPARTWRDWLTPNPVTLKELRGRMRGPRAFGVLIIYLFLMSLFVTVLYALYVLSSEASYSYGGPDRQLIGKFVFGSVVGVEMLLVCFIAPAFTVGAVSGERERQTYDLLRTTLLKARALVLGKLTSALAYIFLLLVAAIPLQSLAFLLGGVDLDEILVATVILLTTAFLFSAAGLFFSSLMRRTLGATILTYVFVLLDMLGLPFILFLVLMFGSAIFSIYYNGSPPVWLQAVLIYVFGVLIATNPLATVIATEVILVNNQTLLYFKMDLYDNSGNLVAYAPLISPWIPLAFFSLAVGVLLILLSILLVKRKER